MMSYWKIVFSGALTLFIIATDAFTNRNILYDHQNNKREQSIDTKLHVEPAIIAVGALTTAGAISFILNSNTVQSKDSQQYAAEYEAREKERDQLAYIEPKVTWTEAELQQYNGDNETGPILLAVKGEVYNVYKGRNFYGPGGEYHIMAGRDASRFLAKNSLVEESNEEKDVPLNIAERASLESWYWIIRNKYDLVGQLEGYDPKSTEM